MSSMRSPQPYRAMSLDECTIARALLEITVPHTTTYGERTTPGCAMPAASKRFVREMSIEARSPNPQVNERQGDLLRELAVRFAQQLPKKVVALAQAEALQLS